MEKRLLLAFVLSAAILVAWSIVFPPPRPGAPGEEAVPGPAGTARPTAVAGKPTAPAAAPAAAPPGPAAAVEAAPPATSGPPSATAVLEDAYLRLELAAAGGAVRSLVLKRYDDDEGRPLELIQGLEHPARLLPLQLAGPEGPDSRPYALERVDRRTVRLVWSDGGGNAAVKEVRLEREPYRVHVTLRVYGSLRGWPVGLGTGMRNVGPRELENRFARWGDVVVYRDGKLERIRPDKLREGMEVPGAGVGFAGLADTYFLMVWRPATPLAAVRAAPLEVLTKEEAKKTKRPRWVARLEVVPAGERVEGELFAAPKEYDLLQRVDEGVERTLRFGPFHPISVLFLKALRWLSAVTGNAGLAIILLTLAIRVVLFPLMHKSTVSMRRMQKLQPKLKAIQEKYRKHKGDPRMRAKMNEELMELYRVEGVNPMGGCLPMLVQLPILWALYTVFAYAIELRHAPFVFWITDLSAKDPYYVTPILMTFTMWLQQRMAPQMGDPQQQRMFRLMPLIFGIMFMGFPSGLVLYWLTNNVLTIVQQEVTFALMGERPKRRRR